MIELLVAKDNKEAVSIAYDGNIVDLWEKLVERQIKIELGSDQTSLHNPWAEDIIQLDLVILNQIK